MDCQSPLRLVTAKTGWESRSSGWHHRPSITPKNTNNANVNDVERNKPFVHRLVLLQNDDKQIKSSIMFIFTADNPHHISHLPNDSHSI
jgi:hypothetical protein